MMKPSKVFFAAASALLLSSCGDEIQLSSSSDISIPSSSEPSLSEVADPAYPLALLEQHLKERYEEDSFGISFADLNDDAPLISMYFRLDDVPYASSSDASAPSSEEDIEYVLSVSSDDFLYALNGRESASVFHIALGSDRFDCDLESEDASVSIPFSQAMHAYLASDGSRDFGAYLDLSKAAITRSLLESASDGNIPEKAYEPTASLYDSLSFPLDLSSIPTVLSSYLQNRIDDGSASLYQNPSSGEYVLTYEAEDLLSEKGEIISKMREYSSLTSAADSLEDMFAGLEAVSISLSLTFSEEAVESLELSLNAIFAEGDSFRPDSLSFSGIGSFLTEEDAEAVLPDDLSSYEEWETNN